MVFSGTKLQLLLEFVTDGTVSLSVAKKYCKQGWKIYEIMLEVSTCLLCFVRAVFL